MSVSFSLSLSDTHAHTHTYTHTHTHTHTHTYTHTQVNATASYAEAVADEMSIQDLLLLQFSLGFILCACVCQREKERVISCAAGCLKLWVAFCKRATKYRKRPRKIYASKSSAPFSPALEWWGAGVETQKNVRGEIGGWGRVPFNEPYAPSLCTIYDGA